MLRIDTGICFDWRRQPQEGNFRIMEKMERTTTYILLFIMLISLLPVMYLGKYDHPTGDDYYYGADTRAAWERTGSLIATVAEAARGTIYQYKNWQGTYSAMLLMYLPPNLFGEWAYHLFTSVILAALSGGIFYVMKPLVCHMINGSVRLWLIFSSLLTLLCVHTLPSQGEAFFWYNGSMYYTGYFAAMLFFFGLLLRRMTNPARGQLAAAGVLAVFLAGGNYVTLLPIILVVFLATAGLLFRHRPAAKETGAILALLLVGFGVSAAAPGNRVRQADMWNIPAWKAIAKSLLQGMRYLGAWTSIWLLLTLIILTPLLWNALSKTKFRFRHPLPVAGLAYGLFCSTSCPTFYTMNSTGPARAVAVVYYSFIFSFLFVYVYLLGYLYRIKTEKMWFSHIGRNMAGKGVLICRAVPAILCVVLLTVQIISGAAWETTFGKAVTLLASGEAAAYEQEYQQRLRILEDEEVRDVVFQPYKNQPEMLYVGDFHSDPQHDTNQKAAQYFHKNSICVDY